MAGPHHELNILLLFFFFIIIFLFFPPILFAPLTPASSSSYRRPHGLYITLSHRLEEWTVFLVLSHGLFGGRTRREQERERNRARVVLSLRFLLIPHSTLGSSFFAAGATNENGPLPRRSRGGSEGSDSTGSGIPRKLSSYKINYPTCFIASPLSRFLPRPHPTSSAASVPRDRL